MYSPQVSPQTKSTWTLNVIEWEESGSKDAGVKTCLCVSLSSSCLWVDVSAYGWNSWSAPLQSSVGGWTARAMSSLFCSGSFSRFSEQSTAVDRDVLDPLHLSYTIIQRHNNNKQGKSQQLSLTHTNLQSCRGHPAWSRHTSSLRPTDCY